MERAAKVFKKQKEEQGDQDDMFFDAKEYHSSNQQVANILSKTSAPKPNEEGQSPTPETKVVAEATLDMEDAQWGDDGEGIDIDLHEEIHVDEANADSDVGLQE
jgi:hypothetical protein